MLLSYNAMSESKSPVWMRGVQIGLGVIAIILSIIVIVHPVALAVSITIIIGIILLIVGIEKIISGIFVANKSRWGNVGLGVLAIIIAGIALSYPAHTAAFVIFLLAIALLFIGIGHVLRGVGDKQRHGWARGFSIGVGVLAIVFAGFVMASPILGAALLSLILGIALLIIGIEIIASGVSGRKMQMPGRKMER
jgi:uncharacterized membrane protein HdeD (DUF308 family)